MVGRNLLHPRHCGVILRLGALLIAGCASRPPAPVPTVYGVKQANADTRREIQASQEEMRQIHAHNTAVRSDLDRINDKNVVVKEWLNSQP